MILEIKDINQNFECDTNALDNKETMLEKIINILEDKISQTKNDSKITEVLVYAESPSEIHHFQGKITTYLWNSFEKTLINKYPSLF